MSNQLFKSTSVILKRRIQENPGELNPKTGTVDGTIFGREPTEEENIARGLPPTAGRTIIKKKEPKNKKGKPQTPLFNDSIDDLFPETAEEKTKAEHEKKVAHKNSKLAAKLIKTVLEEDKKAKENDPTSPKYIPKKASMKVYDEILKELKKKEKETSKKYTVGRKKKTSPRTVAEYQKKFAQKEGIIKKPKAKKQDDFHLFGHHRRKHHSSQSIIEKLIATVSIAMTGVSALVMGIQKAVEGISSWFTDAFNVVIDGLNKILPAGLQIPKISAPNRGQRPSGISPTDPGTAAGAGAGAGIVPPTPTTTPPAAAPSPVPGAPAVSGGGANPSLGPVTAPSGGTGGTRGERNNNPGNIRRSGIQWEGRRAAVTDSAFEEFETPEHGIRALMKNLQSYIKMGLTTIPAIINRWAPPSDGNDTPKYIAHVVARTGISPQQAIDPNNAQQMIALAKAIIQMEIGKVPYSDAQFNQAAGMAGMQTGTAPTLVPGQAPTTTAPGAAPTPPSASPTSPPAPQSFISGAAPSPAPSTPAAPPPAGNPDPNVQSPTGPTSFATPVAGRLSSPFGPRPPVPGVPGASVFHTGLDFAALAGTPIAATAAGQVIAGGFNGGYGNYVDIKHADGVVSRYAHMSKILVRAGQMVQQGNSIGLVGSTGLSSGPHLHVEIIKNGRPVDPQPLLSGVAAPTPADTSGAAPGAPGGMSPAPSAAPGGMPGGMAPAMSPPSPIPGGFNPPSSMPVAPPLGPRQDDRTFIPQVMMPQIEGMIAQMSGGILGQISGLIGPVMTGISALSGMVGGQGSQSMLGQVRDPRLRMLDNPQDVFTLSRNLIP